MALHIIHDTCVMQSFGQYYGCTIYEKNIVLAILARAISISQKCALFSYIFHVYFMYFYKRTLTNPTRTIRRNLKSVPRCCFTIGQRQHAQGGRSTITKTTMMAGAEISSSLCIHVVFRNCSHFSPSNTPYSNFPLYPILISLNNIHAISIEHLDA